MTRIPFILLSTSDGSPITGATPSVTISKDGGAFASATNTPAEIGNGYYYIDLTSAETTVNNNVIVRATATGAQPAAVVWEPEQTVPTAADNAQAVWGATTRTVTNTIPSTSDISGAVWGANTRTLTASPTDISGLATSSALSAVASNVTAVKAKTDNLPASPAAVGSEMTLTAAYNAAKTAAQAGDAMTLTQAYDAAKTASQLTTSDIPTVSAIQSGLATSTALSTVSTNVSAVKAKTDNLPSSPAAVGSEMALTSAAISAVQNGLSTFNASTDTVTLNATEDGTLTAIKTKVDTLTNTDLTGIATSTDVSNAQTAIISRGNEAWTTATGFTVPGDLLGLATAEGLVYNLNLLTQHGNTYWITATGFATPSDIPTAQDIWEYPDRELTSEISVDISAQNIADITESVWNAPDRTMTDLTPKPNQKSIVCTPSNVINSYGVPRLENWTNETAGTQAFDDKINTYITLAKEKMATDLNDQINAAIAYIGADNITELCAWLTGYNLYQDDESTDTDSLPETRYNQYLEQIHRIMENI